MFSGRQGQKGYYETLIYHDIGLGMIYAVAIWRISICLGFPMFMFFEVGRSLYIFRFSGFEKFLLFWGRGQKTYTLFGVANMLPGIGLGLI